ncbi:UNVERIFIED_CONTAM: hypothetical protein FKN15_074838 [Acipenser sinensis]
MAFVTTHVEWDMEYKPFVEKIKAVSVFLGPQVPRRQEESAVHLPIYTNMKRRKWESGTLSK